MVNGCKRLTATCHNLYKFNWNECVHRCFKRSILISSVPSESGIARKKSSLIFAKSRIAPIKGMTIPHLELMAVLIGSRAAQFVMTQLNFTSGTKKFLFRGMYRLPDILFDFKFGLNQQSDAQLTPNVERMDDQRMTEKDESKEGMPNALFLVGCLLTYIPTRMTLLRHFSATIDSQRE
ncbi:unnamed protein product [Brugia timori]|uniref:ABC transmembrane type-1 domain-containing protein n=1 Tax=Brugia timori TaxID=42155 RepID=A0A0R3R8J6_9BILA|nr:unnamed protein product [Brugia timori]